MADPNPAIPPRNLDSLQVLRGWAALVVVLVHVGVQVEGRYGVWPLPRWTLAGSIGVDVFFCLSGFIMYYTSRADFGAAGAWRSFLVRRLLRIYPIYWAIAAATLAVGAWPGSHLNIWPRMSAGWLVKSLLLLPQTAPPLIQQAWTLVHEVRFYAVFGLLLLLPRRIALAALSAWGLASLGVLVTSYVAQSRLDSGLPARALTYLCHPASLEFVAGAWAAVIVSHRPTSRRFDSAILASGLIATASAMYWYVDAAPDTKYAAVTLFAVPSFLLVLGSALAERRWRPRLPAWAVTLGDASYSTYLIHNLILIPVVWNLFPASAKRPTLTLLVCALTALIHVIALGVHIAIERPLHRAARLLSGRLGGHRVAPADAGDGLRPSGTRNVR